MPKTVPNLIPQDFLYHEEYKRCCEEAGFGAYGTDFDWRPRNKHMDRR